MISIITPVYNGIRFMESCITNVNGQQCSDMEHIIVDGGSTDGTVAIIRQYAEKYAHIRWVSEKDAGQSDAMNKGIALAQGEIIGFLNVDDYYEPDVLNRVIRLFEKLPEPGLLVGNCNVWDDTGHYLYLNRPMNLCVEDLMVWRRNVFPVNPSAYFYHRTLHQKTGGYDLQEHFAMDIDFLFRALQTAHVKHIDETLGNYCFIKGSKTHSDTLDGKTLLRLKKLINKYKRRLPLRKQIAVDLRNSRFWAEAELHQLYLGYRRLRSHLTGQ